MRARCCERFRRSPPSFPPSCGHDHDLVQPVGMNARIAPIPVRRKTGATASSMAWAAATSENSTTNSSEQVVAYTLFFSGLVHF
jgi:hypothetical protein